MKRPIILSVVLITLSLHNINAATLHHNGSESVVYIASDYPEFNMTPDKDLKEALRFRKLTEQFIRHQQRGRRNAARNALRKINRMMLHEIRESELRLRFENSIRNSGTLYRKRPNEYSKRSSRYDIPDNRSTGFVYQFRTNLLMQKKIYRDIRRSYELGFYMDRNISLSLLQFSETMRTNIRYNYNQRNRRGRRG